MINQKKLNIIIITTSFSPQNEVGAIRMSKVAKELVTEGHNVNVIASMISSNEIIDQSIDMIESDYLKIFRVKEGILFYKLLRFFKKILTRKKHPASYMTNNQRKSNFIKFIFQLGINFYSFIENRLWQKNALRIIFKNDLILKDTIVISSYPKIAAHKVGLYLKERFKIKIWITDFRDPFVYSELSIKRKKLQILQDKITRESDIVTYVSKNMIHKFSNHEKTSNKFKYLPNGFDTGDLKFINQTDKKHSKSFFRISYVGSLYSGKRDLSILFDVINEIVNEDLKKKDFIRFNYAGKEFNEIQKQLHDYDIEDLVINMGYISRVESLKIQNQSEILIASTWNTEFDIGVIPGKIYEYFLLKKPVIVITNGSKPYSELGSMVKESNLGIEINTMLEILNEKKILKDFILKAYKDFEQGKTKLSNINYQYIDSYDYKNITKKLVNIIYNTIEEY